MILDRKENIKMSVPCVWGIKRVKGWRGHLECGQTHMTSNDTPEHLANGGALINAYAELSC